MAAGKKKGDEPARGPKDEETGVAPAATDGVPNDPQSQAEREAAAEFDDGKGGNVHQLPGRTNGNGNGGSSRDRAAADGQLDVGDEGAGEGEEDDGQMFVWEQGRKVTLGTLIARGTKVEYHVVFGGRRNKGTGGLRAFGEQPILIVRGGIGPVKLVPTYTDEEKVEKVAIEQHVTAKIVADADSEEALSMIAHILDRRGYVKSGEAA